MIPEWGVWVLAAAFTGLFAGYSAGRRVGRREGMREGMAFGPLEVRRRSWEQGVCLICGTPAGGAETAVQQVASEQAEGA